MWEMIDRKEVRDFDGFMTEYTLYTDGEKFVCVFGDHELYGPEDDSNWDFETECVCEAYEWFNDYSTEECDVNENCYDEDSEKYSKSVENNMAVEIWYCV